jgi:hypothetical protein
MYSSSRTDGNMLIVRSFCMPAVHSPTFDLTCSYSRSTAPNISHTVSHSLACRTKILIVATFVRVRSEYRSWKQSLDFWPSRMLYSYGVKSAGYAYPSISVVFSSNTINCRCNYALLAAIIVFLLSPPPVQLLVLSHGTCHGPH